MKIIKKVIIGIVIVIVLGFISFYAYQWKVSNSDENKKYSKETQEELNDFQNEIKKNLEKEPENQKHKEDIESEDTIDEEEAPVENNQENNSEVGQSMDNPDDSIPVSEENVVQEETKTIDEIAPSYEQAFNDLEVKANQLLENLVSQAKKEYGNLTEKEKENPATLSAMASNYLARSKELEKQIDKVFYDVLSDMKEELKTNGLDTAILKEFEKEYTNSKKERKRELMDMAMEVKQ